MDQKLNIKVQKGKVGSLDNVKHRPGGGDKKVFNDVEYMRQVSDHAVSITNASGPGSLTGSRRESSSQVCSSYTCFSLSILLLLLLLQSSETYHHQLYFFTTVFACDVL